MVANCINGSSVIIRVGGNALKELSFSSGKASLKDLEAVFSMCGWTHGSTLHFLPLLPNDNELFMVIGNDTILAIVSKEQSELFRGQKNCEYLTHEEVMYLQSHFEE